MNTYTNKTEKNPFAQSLYDISKYKKREYWIRKIRTVNLTLKSTALASTPALPFKHSRTSSLTVVDERYQIARISAES